MKRFNVVVAREDGGVEVHPMKEWLRQHPEHIPSGLDPAESNSHSLRDGLKKRGWRIEELPSEVRLLMPGNDQPQNTIDSVLGANTEDDNDAEPEAAFALEYQLRDFIAQNLPTIKVEGRRLQLYVDPTGRDGIEFPSGTGPIDILAVDGDGTFYVFELKRARSPDHAIGQLARYMGWVGQTIGKGREIRGVIVARAFSDNLRYAVLAMPKVSLFEYEVEFRLKPARQLGATND
jgi:hypothetical protein